MKKLLTAILCLVLAAVMLCGFAACQQNPEALKEDLLGSLENASNKSQNFEATVSATKDGQNAISAKILGYGTQDNVNADAYFQADDVLGAMVLRNNAAYVATIESTNTVAPENLQAEVEKLAYNNPDVIFTKQADDILEGIGGGTGGSVDISGILEGVSEEDVAKITEIAETISRNLMSLMFNKVEQTDDGYLLSIDLHKLYQDIWNKVYAVATTIDENNQITISELYASKPVQEILSLVLDGVSGKQVEEILRMVAEIPEATLPFEILAAEDKESAIDYIGKYLETIKIDGTVTVGSLRISDLITTSFGDAVDFTDELDEIKKQLDEELADHLKNDFVFELRFDKRKNLVGAKLVISDMGSALPYDEISVEVAVLKEQPKLLDTTKLNSVAVSEIKITNCADNLFYEYDFETWDMQYYTLKEGDLSASIIVDAFDDNSMTVFVNKGMDSAFQFELYQVDGQWMVSEEAPYLDYDGSFYIEADCTANGNNVLVNYSLVDDNDVHLFDFNFTVTFETIAH